MLWACQSLLVTPRAADSSTTCKARWCMETQTLHRGRLIDHLQLVVKDLTASERRDLEASADTLRTADEALSKG